jgi:hypothetical protein
MSRRQYPGRRVAAQTCDACRLAEELAKRIREHAKELKAFQTPEDLRAEAAELLERAKGLEAGTIPLPGKRKDA